MEGLVRSLKINEYPDDSGPFPAASHPGLCTGSAVSHPGLCTGSADGQDKDFHHHTLG